MSNLDDATIMVIGTDTHFCYLMRSYVRKSSHQITFAYISDEALEKAAKENPAAIILEVDQPDGSGWTLLHALKNNEITRHVPIVLCSWLEDELRGLDAGANACLRKPILYNDFREALEFIGIRS